MTTIETPTQILTQTCRHCGPIQVSWKWRCDGDTEVACLSCGEGLGTRVKTIRKELQKHGVRAVRRILFG